MVGDLEPVSSAPRVTFVWKWLRWTRWPLSPAIVAVAALTVAFDVITAWRDVNLGYLGLVPISPTLPIEIALVVMVTFLFLRKVSATIIPSLAVPLSIIGTFAVMYLLGYTIDIISLMALTLCVGFVVDDAVVMLENVVRHMEEGKSRREAALIGAREIGFTILSMTLSLAAVFIPVLLMGGIVGRLFREFALTVTAAVLVSGFVSLTFVPMMCSRYLRPHHTAPAGIGAKLRDRLAVRLPQRGGTTQAVTRRPRPEASAPWNCAGRRSSRASAFPSRAR